MRGLLDTATVTDRAGVWSGGTGRELRVRLSLYRALVRLWQRGLAGKIVVPGAALWSWWSSEGTCDEPAVVSAFDCEPARCMRGWLGGGCNACEVWARVNLQPREENR